MIITIDTKVDSPADIRRAITFLRSLGDDSTADFPIAASPPVDTTSMMDMFNDSPTSSQRATEGSAPDFSSFLNLAKDKGAPVKPSPRTQIEFY